jgi:hypothetical protein
VKVIDFAIATSAASLHTTNTSIVRGKASYAIKTLERRRHPRALNEMRRTDARPTIAAAVPGGGVSRDRHEIPIAVAGDWP